MVKKKPKITLKMGDFSKCIFLPEICTKFTLNLLQQNHQNIRKVLDPLPLLTNDLNY